MRVEALVLDHPVRVAGSSGTHLDSARAAITSSIAPSRRDAPRWIRDGESKQANAIVASNSFKRARDMFVERFFRFLVDLLMAAILFFNL